MAIRCEKCRQPLPVLPGQSAYDVQCPWCGTRNTGSSVPLTASSPVSRTATVTAPRALVAPPPASRRIPEEPTKTSGQGLLVVGIVMGVIGLLLSVGIVVFLLIPARKPEPLATVPETAVSQPVAQVVEPDTGPRRTKTTNPSLVIRPRDGNSGAIPRKPGDDIALPRMVDFMGSQASGKQICIIADCSGSMGTKGRMETLKLELEKTLKTLQSDQQYYIIFFDSRAEQMPDMAWVNGGKDDEKVLAWVRGQRPRGGTLPMPAFDIAFELEPKPDVIFFMTDGIIPPNVPAGVARLNEGVKPKITINSILFGGEGEARRAKGKKGRSLSGEDQLRQIATDSGGTYRFVPDRAGR